MYRERYPALDTSRFAVVANGYDESSFQLAEARAGSRKSDGPLVLLHSGVLYPVERDPRCFYEALKRLRDLGRIGPDRLKVVLRSTGHDKHHRSLIDEYGIAEIVELAPPLAYREALQEMLEVDGLLIVQASNCNHQIPAKIYEYLRARKPIFALTDPRGDTAQVLRDASLDSIVPLDDADLIEKGLVRFLEGVRAGTGSVADDAEIARHSRLARTLELGGILDEVAR
jgi:hypothetical protein